VGVGGGIKTFSDSRYPGMKGGKTQTDGFTKKLAFLKAHGVCFQGKEKVVVRGTNPRS